MIKTASRFLIGQLLPGWLFALVAVLGTYFVFTPLYSWLASTAWPVISREDLEPPTFYVDPSLPEGDVVIQWDKAPVVIADPFSANRLAENHLPEWWPNISLNSTSWDVQFQPASSRHVWRPATQEYKQVRYLTDHNVYVDLAAQQDDSTAEVALGSVIAGFRHLPLDIFGGLFLITSVVPEAKLATQATSHFAIGQNNLLTNQFMAEVWALDHQLFAVSHWVTLIIAALLVSLPWLTRRAFTYYVSYLLSFLLLNTLLFISFLFQFQWLYPLALPLLSLLVAGIWHGRGLSAERRYQQLASQYHQSTALWVNRLLDDNQPEAAHRFLIENQLTTKPFVSFWLLVARGFERNRHYDKAIACLQEALVLEPGNHEAKDKLKHLCRVTDGTKTQVLTQGTLALPVAQLGDLTLGRYQLTKEIGRGAMGVVYEAQDPKIHRLVALKVVHLKNLGLDEVDKVKQRFFREAQAAGKLTHPNIVTVYDVGEEHDVAYIAMDLLKGNVLDELLNQRPIDVSKMVQWIAQAAEALAYAHDNEVIHRDVKPANMIIESRTGQLKLTDFGVARIAGVQQTQTGIVLGSPSYMSPEQMRGETLSGATDIFSLGVTLYQCVTGELPFSGDTLPALAYAITQTKQESPRAKNPDVPVSLVRIINKAMQKDPTERYESARDFANSLSKWVSERAE